MTTTIDSSPAAGPPAPTGRRRSTGHIVAIVVGCLLLLPAGGLVLGGGGLAVAQAVATDDDGYFRFSIDRVASDGVAVGTTDLWLDDADAEAPWVFDFLDVDVRLRATGAGATDDLFVGIARAQDVQRYLAGAAWSEVVEVNDRFPRYREIDGVAEIEPPVDQDFWTTSRSGSGEQELTWAARGGRWSIVVMNADGSPDVAADVEIGVRSGAVTPIAITLLVVGGVLLAGAVVLIVVGARGRRAPGTPAPPAWPTPGAGPRDAAPARPADPLPPPTVEPAGPDGGPDVHRAGVDRTPSHT